MKNSDIDGAVALATMGGMFTIFGVMLVGWVMNVIAIWHTMDNPITAKFILRVVGIFVAPIGGILGYL